MSTLPIEACAASSGPYALSQMVYNLVTDTQMVNNVYAPYFFTSIVWVDGIGSFEDIFVPSVAEKIPALFDGTKGLFEISKSLPTTTDKMYDSTFINTYRDDIGIGKKFRTAVAVHDLLTLGPVTPIRLYYGTEDVNVPYFNVFMADSAWRANGAERITVDSLQANHFTIFDSACAKALEWFSTFN